MVVMKQGKVDGDFSLVATGILIRPMAMLSLDVIIDTDQGEFQSLVVQHPIIKNYPQDWETKLRLFLSRQISIHELPQIVRYVDQYFNQDFRPPSWEDYYAVKKSLVFV